MKLYIKDLTAGIKKHKRMMNFDGWLYMMGIPMMVVTFLLLAINSIIYKAGAMTGAELAYQYVKYLVATFILPIITGVFSLIVDKRPIKPMIKALLCYPLFLGSWILINIKCIFKQDTSWEKIQHNRSISIEEKQEPVQINEIIE